MRQVVSFGSVKAISLDKARLMSRLKDIAAEAATVFPEIVDIRLFGSLSRGEETGLSDVDIFILTSVRGKNPIERMKPYFNFFIDRLNIAVDMIVADESEIDDFKDIQTESVSLLGNAL